MNEYLTKTLTFLEDFRELSLSFDGLTLQSYNRLYYLELPNISLTKLMVSHD